MLLLFLPQTYEISEWLTLAEREMNSLLRAWSGGYESRKNVVEERAEWLSMIPDTDDPAPFAEVYKNFFDLNQEDLKSGESQGAAMGKVRMTAFLPSWPVPFLRIGKMRRSRFSTRLLAARLA